MIARSAFAVVILATIIVFVSTAPAPEPHKFGGHGVAYPVGIASVPVAVPVPVVPVYQPVIQPVSVIGSPIYGFYG